MTPQVLRSFSSNSGCCRRREVEALPFGLILRRRPVRPSGFKTISLRLTFRALALLAGAILSGAAAGAGPASPAFVDNAVCGECHQQAFDAWRGSHHDRAMQEAGADTVLGDFGGTRFSDRGATTRFFKRDGGFFVNTEGPDGKRRDFEVKYTFGVDPLQQYLVELPGGRLQAITVAWDTRDRRWFALYPGQRIEPGDPLHWTGVYQSWNGMCAECHSTNLRTGYDLERETYDTTWSELDVSCQACHGPGSEHVAWARANIEGENGSADGNGLVTRFQGRDGYYEVAQCARCHARRERVSPDDRHGRSLLDDFVPATLRAEFYHADGQIDDEVYVYGSFLQSKMYAAGVRCSDCHDSHSLQTRAEGNALCTRCHQQHPDPRFPGLEAKNYDSPAHYFHAEGSQGARCVNCHMPGKLYMVVDFRRDHSFRLPRPDLTVKIGTPNPCTTCHKKESAAWAAAEIRKRFGQSDRATHYGEILAAARAGAADAGPALVRLAADPSGSGIVRATALAHLGRYGSAGAKVLATGLSDPDPLVRIGALRGIEALPPRVRVAGALKVIEDPVRGVRVEAARLLAAIAPGDLPARLIAAYDSAIAEHEAALRARADLPSGRLGLALLAEARRDPARAEHHYRKALEMDRYFLPARFNLATMLNRGDRNADAESVLREGISLTPDEGELHYSLGLLLAEQGELKSATEALARAAERLRDRGRVHYNLGIALTQIGRSSDAERALLRASRLDPRDTDVLFALALHYERERNWPRAVDYAERLVRLLPESIQAREQLDRYRALRKYAKP